MFFCQILSINTDLWFYSFPVSSGKEHVANETALKLGQKRCTPYLKHSTVIMTNIHIALWHCIMTGFCNHNAGHSHHSDRYSLSKLQAFTYHNDWHSPDNMTDIHNFVIDRHYDSHVIYTGIHNQNDRFSRHNPLVIITGIHMP